MTAPQCRIHAKFAKERALILDALEADPTERFKRRVSRIDGCCATPEIRVDESGKPAVRMNACRDRLCPRCQKQRGAAVRERAEAVVRTFDAPRFITLTLLHRCESLDQMRERAADAFRRIRERPEWKSRVKAGVWVIEVTRNTKTERWHLHIHAIADGQFFPQALLAKMWHEVTGDSMVCDIRAVPSRTAAVRYIADYVAKPLGMAEWGAEAICEFAEAMHGVRMVHTFGKAHAANVEAAEPERETRKSTFVIHAVVLRRLAAEGNAKAEFALRTFAGYSRQTCEAVGERWLTSEYGVPVVSEPDVAAALKVCSELERGILIDPPPRHEPTRDDIERECLFSDRAI